MSDGHDAKFLDPRKKKKVGSSVNWPVGRGRYPHNPWSVPDSQIGTFGLGAEAMTSKMSPQKVEPINAHVLSMACHVPTYVQYFQIQQSRHDISPTTIPRPFYQHPAAFSRAAPLWSSVAMCFPTCCP